VICCAYVSPGSQYGFQREKRKRAREPARPEEEEEEEEARMARAPAELVLVGVEGQEKLLHVEVHLEAQQIARGRVLLLLHLQERERERRSVQVECNDCVVHSTFNTIRRQQPITFKGGEDTYVRLDGGVLDEHEVGLLVPEQGQGNAAQRHFLVEDDLVPIVDGHRVCQVVHHLRITTRVCPFSLSVNAHPMWPSAYQ
jgi:hypothetical protein